MMRVIAQWFLIAVVVGAWLICLSVGQPERSIYYLAAVIAVGFLYAPCHDNSPAPRDGTPFLYSVQCPCGSVIRADWIVFIWAAEWSTDPPRCPRCREVAG